MSISSPMVSPLQAPFALMGGSQLVLDLLSTQSSAAYSLRKLRNAYTGNAIRVRRSLDNAETDIGFVNNELDTTALMNHVGYQNLLTYSEQFDNAAWEGLANSAETLAINSEVAPDGTMTADRCTVIGAISGRYQNLTLPSAGLVTLSTHIKRGSQGTWARISIYETSITGNQARCWLNMQTGALGTIEAVGTGWSGVTAEVTSVGNDWYRVVVTATCTATGISALINNANNNGSTTRSAGDNRILWGTQLTQGALQPYQQTVATANTGNGFVTTWYDQSGNAKHATQATAGNQPFIVTSGVLETKNGKPTIRFASNLSLANTALIGDIANTPMTVNSVNESGYLGGTAGIPRLYCQPSAYSYNNLNIISWVSVPYAIRTYVARADSSQEVFQNSESKGTATEAISATFASSAFNIGIAGVSFTNGAFQEVIVLASSLSTADRQTIERNQGTFYGIRLLDQYDYFVNAVDGNDSNNGLTSNSAWKTLSKLTTSLLIKGEEVKVFVFSGTYNTADDYINIATGNTDYLGATLTVEFDAGTIMDGVNMAGSENGVEQSGNIPWTLNLVGNGLIIQNYEVAGADSPNGVGNRGVATLNAYNVHCINCEDGFSSHGNAFMNIYNSSASECVKSPFLHVENSTVYAYNSSFRERTGGGSFGIGTFFGNTVNIHAVNCEFINTTSTDSGFIGLYENCQIGSSTVGAKITKVAGGNALVFRKSYINAYIDGNSVVTLDRCFGKFSTRIRTGGSVNMQNCVITAPSTGQSAVVFSNFDSGASNSLILNNNIFKMASGFMSVDSINASYMVSANAQFFNNNLFGGAVYDSDLITADSGGTVRVGTITTDPLIGVANTLVMSDYAFNSGSPCIGAGVGGVDIGFSQSQTVAIGTL